MSEKAMSVLLIVVLLLLVLIPFLLTTNLTVLLLLFLLIYLIFVRHIYLCMIAHKPDRIRRQTSAAAACGHNFDYTFQRSNPSNNSNNSNNNNCNHSNIEISMISSDTTTTTTTTTNTAVHEHSHFNTEPSSVVTGHVPRSNNLLTIETLYVALQETDGQRSPGPPSYDEAIRNKHRLSCDEQPPNYSEAIKNIDVEKC